MASTWWYQSRPNAIGLGLLVTHSAIAAAYGDRVITLRDGRIVEDVVNRPSRSTPSLRPVS